MVNIVCTGSRNASKENIKDALCNIPIYNNWWFDSRNFLIGDCKSGADKYFLEIMNEQNPSFKKDTWEIFKANWIEHGKKAGPIRNQEMVDKADCLIACWDGRSKGTRDCINKALNKGIPIFVYVFEKSAEEKQ